MAEATEPNGQFRAGVLAELIRQIAVDVAEIKTTVEKNDERQRKMDQSLAAGTQRFIQIDRDLDRLQRSQHIWDGALAALSVIAAGIAAKLK